jgi:hypothetical protein
MGHSQRSGRRGGMRVGHGVCRDTTDQRPPAERSRRR